jgi:hypothetical protein
MLLNLFIEVLLTHVPIHLRILIQGDGVACLIDMCQVKDPDGTLMSQFVTIHALHPTCKDHTKKMYEDTSKKQCIEQAKKASMNLQAPDD